MGNQALVGSSLKSCLMMILALVGINLTSTQASAQAWIAPDHSIVQIGRQQAIPLGGSFMVGPVVVGSNNKYVRIGGPFSGTIVNPNAGFNSPAFIKPFYANDRIKGSNFYGGPSYHWGYVGPYQPWFKQ